MTSRVALPENMAKRNPLCILLVEDDRDSLSALSRLLRLSGHRPLAAASADEAVRLAAAERCDVVVSDVGLPDRSGLDLMRELSARYNVPGIAVSGYTDAADVRECAKAGFARHLKKPIDFQALLDAVEELSRGSAHLRPDGGVGPGAPGTSS
jgi:DNA-binding response OmpR family regulator